VTFNDGWAMTKRESNLGTTQVQKIDIALETLIGAQFTLS
jgi:hypothetical protein